MKQLLPFAIVAALLVSAPTPLSVFDVHAQSAGRGRQTPAKRVKPKPPVRAAKKPPVRAPQDSAARGGQPPAALPASTGDANKDLFLRAARTAWRYGERYYRPATGFIAAVPFYDYSTVWDLGSSLAMMYCARELGFVPERTYKARMSLALRTLAKLPLFDKAGFNKDYRVSTAAMVDRHQRPSSVGFGWSVTDIGRFLIWLKIVGERDPEFAQAAEAVARKLNYSRLVQDGYLWGEEIAPTGKRGRYVEGILGYEQYAAQGFALWGAHAERSMAVEEHAMPIEIMGQQVAADSRQRDRLTSEPFVLLGLEIGLHGEMERLARAVLDVQRERARRTGIVTIVSEDAIDQPPHYFYYYCVLANSRQFSVDVQDPRAVVNGPRWVSTKAAFGWHALFPSDYTRQAVETVQPASTPRGWASGVFEHSTRSTATLNVNTEAGVLTAAVYALHGQPMLTRSRTARNSTRTK
jgi:hypothetical protein